MDLEEGKKKGNKMDTDKNEVDASEIIKNIMDNYKMLEESIVSQLSLSNKCHGLTTGASRETIWLQLFERIIPKKFVIEQSVFIIDSNLNKSREIDLAIIDNTYTPYIFQYGKLKFVPIEAVAAVIECKSTSVTDNTMKEWCKSIEALRTSRESIVRLATGTLMDGKTYVAKRAPSAESTQTSTRPIRIFCGYNSSGLGSDKQFFDFILIAKDKDKKRIEVKPRANKNLGEWYIDLDHYGNGQDKDVIKNEELEKYSLEGLKIIDNGEENSLLTLNLQLNQLLMLINNPIFFPHLAYARMFNQIGGKSVPPCESPEGGV